MEKDSKIILAFDGSYSRDSTALVGISFDQEKPHLRSWALGKTSHRNKLWKVPREEVLARIQTSSRNTVEFVVDPMGWHNELGELEEIYGSDKILGLEETIERRWLKLVQGSIQLLWIKIFHMMETSLVSTFDQLCP